VPCDRRLVRGGLVGPWGGACCATLADAVPALTDAQGGRR
jgi:hypothetical protein